MKQKSSAKIGISLSGGAAYGIAHLGVLRHLEKQGIGISHMSGVSAGAVVASLYAFDVSLDQIEDETKRLSWEKISNLTFTKMGLISNDSLGKLVTKLIGEKNIEESLVPLSILATDIHTGEEVVFKEGPVAKAVMASAAIPGIFNPVMHEERMLVDGGLSNNLPYKVLVDMGAKVTVGVNVLADSITFVRPKNYMHILSNSFLLLLSHSRQHTLEKFDVLIEPDLSAFNSSDFSKQADIIEAGRQAAAASHEKLQEKLGEKTRWWRRII